MTKPTVENYMMHLQKNPWHTSKIHKQEMSLGKNHLSPLYSLVHLSPASLIFWNTLMWVWKACRKSHKLSSVCQGAGAECAWGKARTVSAKECSQQHSPIPMLTLSVSPSYRSDDSLYIFILCTMEEKAASLMCKIWGGDYALWSNQGWTPVRFNPTGNVHTKVESGVESLFQKPICTCRKVCEGRVWLIMYPLNA